MKTTRMKTSANNVKSNKRQEVTEKQNDYKQKGTLRNKRKAVSIAKKVMEKRTAV